MTDRATKMREYRRAWAERNPERVRALRRGTMARWRQRNPVLARERRREASVPYKARLRAAGEWRLRRTNEARTRRARLHGAAGTITRAQWEALKAAYGQRCARCKAKAPLTMDHVIPLVLGGQHTLDNIQPLCGPCNCEKGTGTEDYRCA